MLKLQLTIAIVLGIARLVALHPLLLKHASVIYKFLLVNTAAAGYIFK
jgi:hypothetical protein